MRNLLIATILALLPLGFTTTAPASDTPYRSILEIVESGDVLVIG